MPAMMINLNTRVALLEFGTRMTMICILKKKIIHTKQDLGIITSMHLNSEIIKMHS